MCSFKMLSGTEADIINTVARLKGATKSQISKQVGFSLYYIDFLCHYLVRKGYLVFRNGHYSLDREGIKLLLHDEIPGIDKNLLKEIAGELAKDISGELKKTIKSIKIPVPFREIRKEKEEEAEEQVKIKTDFELPIEDESLALESNINKIGVSLEREKSDIDKSVRLFKEIQKMEKKK